MQRRFTGVRFDDVRLDLIGVDSLHGARLSAAHECEPYEVRIRTEVHLQEVGVTSSTALDAHGKSLASALLNMSI
jgi:hypothetical protein